MMFAVPGETRGKTKAAAGPSPVSPERSLAPIRLARRSSAMR